MILSFGIVAGIAVLVNTFLLTSAAIRRPSAPPSVNAVRDQWGYNILLPTYLPDCLAYEPGGASIVSNSSSASGLALQISLSAVSGLSCTTASGSTVQIWEAPALESLTGNVSTVSQGRMQFARAAQMTDSGQQRVTLQWHCMDVMCRITGVTSDTVSETVLAKMADSFQVIAP